MNYVITDVKARRKQYTDMKNGNQEAIDAVNRRMLTVEQYQSLARRIIGKWAPSYARSQMLNSDDAVDFVAHRIMVGDWGYNSKKSNIKTYRGYCGKRAIQVYLSILSEQQNVVTNYLDSHSERRTDSDKSVYDVISDDNAPHPSERMETIERCEEVRRDLLILMGDLNDTQRACITMHHIDENSMADIGRELGITREGVRRSIEEGMKAMRKIAGVRVKKKK